MTEALQDRDQIGCISQLPASVASVSANNNRLDLTAIMSSFDKNF